MVVFHGVVAWAAVGRWLNRLLLSHSKQPTHETTVVSKSPGNAALNCEIKGPLSPEHALIHGAVLVPPAVSRGVGRWASKRNREVHALVPASRASGFCENERQPASGAKSCAEQTLPGRRVQLEVLTYWGTAAAVMTRWWTACGGEWVSLSRRWRRPLFKTAGARAHVDEHSRRMDREGGEMRRCSLHGKQAYVVKHYCLYVRFKWRFKLLCV